MKRPAERRVEIIPALLTPRFMLTIPGSEAAPRYLAFAIENDAHLACWEPPHPEGFFTEAFWRRRIEQNRDEFTKDMSMRLGVFRRDDRDGPVLGHVNFGQFVRGAFQACYLGYSVDHRWEGKGVMTEALKAAIAFVFGPLGMHRIMANYLPTNERSGRLLKRLGFVVEGYARDYLYIHDGWREHIMTSLTNPHPMVPSLG
jgi:[ribosomal protein S5]-alanine N-acetyltransferase